MLGYPDQALALASKAITIASTFDNPQSLEQAHRACAITQLLRRDHGAVLKHADAAMAIARDNGMTQQQAMGRVPRGWALAFGRDGVHSIEEIRTGLNDTHATGSLGQWTYFSGALAQACLALGRVEEGLAAIEVSISRIRERDDRIWAAETHRIKGELLGIRGDDCAEVEACFRSALDVAKGQDAKSWELRAAMSMARLWRNDERAHVARELLAPIYDWFTEGFDTPDLKDAKALLDELN